MNPLLPRSSWPGIPAPGSDRVIPWLSSAGDAQPSRWSVPGLLAGPPTVRRAKGNDTGGMSLEQLEVSETFVVSPAPLVTTSWKYVAPQLEPDPPVPPLEALVELTALVEL